MFLIMAMVMSSTPMLVLAEDSMEQNKSLLNDKGIEVLFECLDEDISYELIKTKYSYIYSEIRGNICSAAIFNFDGSAYYYTSDTVGVVYKYDISDKKINMEKVNMEDAKDPEDILYMINRITDNLDINSAEKIIFFEEPGEYDLTNLELGLMAPGYGSLAEDALVEYFGKEYIDKNLGSRTSRGQTATLYGYMSYGRIAKLNQHLLKLGADVVGFLVSLKFGSKVGLIITSWNFVNGIYKAAKNQDVIIYNATVYYDQYAKVKGTTYASAGKNVYGQIAVGEEGSVFEERKTAKDYYYNDVNYLCNLAIDNYLR